MILSQAPEVFVEDYFCCRRRAEQFNKSHSLKKKCKPELMFPKLTDWRQMTIVLMAVGSDRDTMIFGLDMLLKGGDNQDFI